MGAWIEICCKKDINFVFQSHPTMGAWIEIKKFDSMEEAEKVAPHDGCVD